MVLFLAGRGGVRHVVRPLRRLGVKHPMRVNSDRKAGVVAEYDGNRIAHLGVDGWAHDSQLCSAGSCGLSVVKEASVYSR